MLRGPGGKVLAIADHNRNASITAVELHPHRARLLQNLLRAPESNAERQIQVLVADAQHLPVSVPFDRVLADVPCSGTGTLARNPEIKWRLSPNDLLDLHDRQIAILRSALTQVAPGGRLVYSTCSLEKEENENIVEQTLTENSSFTLLDCRDELNRLKAAGELTWTDVNSLTRGLPPHHPRHSPVRRLLRSHPAKNLRWVFDFVRGNPCDLWPSSPHFQIDGNPRNNLLPCRRRLRYDDARWRSLRRRRG